ncbi:hypothetical protein HU200_049009 [Digitaria exilis]|uniref:Protein kinase domain-containing protein n=1 Tax=Digitaria exilis TaxID=1010633 RepID=A0A835E7H2_9POAL|nr:hypothetical protein HU200_049009 [Digitaria exilis]
MPLRSHRPWVARVDNVRKPPLRRGELLQGILRNGTIAVKKLLNTHLHEAKFHHEVECLIKAKHKNVVRFLGYCADTQGKVENFNGKLVMADVPQRLLCFEYLPKGSLHEYITDLKPANILLDSHMVPKIADFGLSRCFDEKQSHVITSKLFGSLGYLAPEFYCGRITFKSDIYSLGVIMIEILTRERMYPEDYDVLKSWANRLEASHREKQLEQLHLCAEIGKECTDYDPRRRPDAWTIVCRLHEADIDMSNLSIAQEEQHGDGSLIGAIGRELSLKCLVRLSRSEYGLVASLSRDFRSLVRSGEIYRLRRQAGVAEHWIYFCVSTSRSNAEWSAFDPARQRWIQVPKMPNDFLLRNTRKESLAVGTDLLVFVIGMGVEGIPFSLFRYSILTNSWIQTDGMNHPRHLFGSASVGHNAYLAGGSDCYGTVLSSVEMYDSDKREWEILPNMNRARKLCSGVFMDGKLFVIGGRGSIKEELMTCGEEYDFERGSWRVIENMCEGLNRQVKDYAPPMVAVVSNELYGCDYTEKNVKRYDKENNRWITLGKWPVNVSSMNGWGISFKACGDKLIIIGGRKSYSGELELHSWVPDGRPLFWKLIARRRMEKVPDMLSEKLTVNYRT